MIEILGYAPVEPDGSVRIEVPANVAFRMSVLDANARRISPVAGRVAAGAARARWSPATAATSRSRAAESALARPRGAVRLGVGGRAPPPACAFPHTFATVPAFIPQQAGVTMARRAWR